MGARPYLIHPRLDWVFLGAFSLPFAGYFLWKTGKTFEDPDTLKWLLLAVSYPHFLMSYALFYGPGGPWKRHPWVAFGVPLFLLVPLLYVWVTHHEPTLVWMGTIAWPLLIWHFARQAYGVSLWMGAEPGRPASPLQKYLLLGLLLGIGGYGYAFQQQAFKRANLFGFPMATLRFSEDTVFWVRQAFLLTLIVFALTWALDWLRNSRRSAFGLLGFLPVASLWSWFDPSLLKTPIIGMVPVFHAIQYFPFVYRVETNRGGPTRTAALYSGTMVVGTLLFFVIPRVAANQSELAGLLAISSVSIFLNIHHYFIDGVLWRFRDPEVREKLRIKG